MSLHDILKNISKFDKDITKIYSKDSDIGYILEADTKWMSLTTERKKRRKLCEKPMCILFNKKNIMYTSEV